ncbi:unnamed protein product [Hymenolepis diminuta]|uniref:Uncharacterized protein n=1 Tax=Hymenolepis diminuta TaxID=6216 RepID=A0A3P6WRT0_HYMDI|nr:unnamed protein product [Hymenolepis diminuta]
MQIRHSLKLSGKQKFKSQKSKVLLQHHKFSELVELLLLLFLKLEVRKMRLLQPVTNMNVHKQ